MTAAIARARVCEALRVATCRVPDFVTRKKTSLVWNKVYISIQDGKLRFVELNLLQRIIRYLIGSYTDTILDKVTLEKVKEYVHSIKTATDCDSIAAILLEEARAKHDCDCIRNMLGNCNNQEAMELVEPFLEEGFSEDFLSVAITLARENLIKNPEDKMWQSMTEVFLYNLNFEAVLTNEGLLREVLGLPFLFQLPSQCIIVQDKEIEEAVRKRLQKVKDTLEKCLQAKTLRDDLKILDLLEKIDNDKELPEVLRPYCFKIEQALRDALVNSRVYPSLVQAYLEDQKQIAGRLFYHMDLSFVHPLLSDRNASQRYYRDAVMNELCANYEVADPCSAKMTWREQIANGLFKAEHRVLADARAKELELTLDQYFQWIEDPQSSIALPELELLSRITGQPVVIVCLKKKENKKINHSFEKEPIISYVNNENIWYPEENELIDEVKCFDEKPIIVGIDFNCNVKEIRYPEEDEITSFDEEPSEVNNEEIWHAEGDEWIDGINLSFDKEPIIFNIDNKENWSPVELKKK